MYVTIASDSITLQEGSNITFLRGVDISTISAEAEAILGTTNQFNWVVRISIKSGGGPTSFRLSEVSNEPRWTNNSQGALNAVNALSAVLKTSEAPKSTSVDTVAILPPGTTTWTNMPSALTFFAGQAQWVVPMDLTLKSDMKLHVLMGGSGGSGSTSAKIRLLYRTQVDGYSTTITDYTTAGTSEVQVAIGTSTETLISTAWIPIIAGARTNSILALAGVDGDGSTDPEFLSVYLETR